MRVEDPAAERRQRGWAQTLQITREKDDVGLSVRKRLADGRIQSARSGMGDGGEMMRRDTRNLRSRERSSIPVVADDHDDLAPNVSGCAGVENALKRRPFMRGQNPDLQHCRLRTAFGLRATTRAGGCRRLQSIDGIAVNLPTIDAADQLLDAESELEHVDRAFCRGVTTEPITVGND